MTWIDLEDPSAAIDSQPRADLAAIASAEHARCLALGQGNVQRLGEICHPEMRFTHLSGRTEDKETYLRRRANRPVAVQRQNLHVAQFGDTAVMRGRIVTLDPNSDGPVDATALQVWVKVHDIWQLLAYQATRE